MWWSVTSFIDLIYPTVDVTLRASWLSPHFWFSSLCVCELILKRLQVMEKKVYHKLEKQMRWVMDDSLGVIFHIYLLEHMLWVLNNAVLMTAFNIFFYGEF